MAPGVSVVALSCPKCGGRLQITSERSVFPCGYCSSTIAVDRSGATISLSLFDTLSRVQLGTERAAAELAINRLSAELTSARMEYEAFKSSTHTLERQLEARAGYAALTPRRYVLSGGKGFLLGFFGMAAAMTAFVATNGWVKPALIHSTFGWMAAETLGGVCTAALNIRRHRARTNKSLTAIAVERDAMQSARSPLGLRLRARIEELEVKLAGKQHIADL